MNHYETVLIVTPVLAEGEAAKMVKEYEEYLKGQDAEIVHREDWGLKQLAYPIEKKTTGKKRPVKYKLTDSEGNEHPWTGIGRMPRVYKDALESGKSLEDYAI